ncbi:MAG: carbon-nitrogen family hydrolase [Cyanobacteria bacterium CYA]|nr:MAG: carbon-nitrogen family hydrolase [Cyanobacteria bacterium CYA]
MRAHLIQFDISWENRLRNFEAVEEMLGGVEVQPDDLILLPELFDSGFSLNVAVTNDANADTEGFIADLAGRLRAYVMGGRTVLPDGAARAFNQMSVKGPRGQTLCEYAKIHPFSYGREPEAFAGGDKIVTFSWAERLCVCPAVCYDLRFPELFRRGMLRGAQVFAVGANWPDVRQAHWRALLIARAIENQAFVLGVNRCGRDPHLSYAGGSMVIDPHGIVLGELGAAPGVLSVEVDPREVQAWRRQFGAWRDVRLISE